MSEIALCGYRNKPNAQILESSRHAWSLDPYMEKTELDKKATPDCFFFAKKNSCEVCKHIIGAALRQRDFGYNGKTGKD